MKIKTILHRLGLRDNVSDLCLFTGTIDDPSNLAVPPSMAPLTLGLYVKGFIPFFEDPAFKHQFKQLLADLIMVEFMGTVDWFLGIHFQ
jgi:hypothetical protein